MLPSWQLLYPNKSLQAFFLPEIDVVSQNCKTQNTPLTQRVIPEQFQTPPGRSFRTLLTSIPLDEDVINAAPFTVHADLNTKIFQGTGKSLTCILCSLVCIEYLRCLITAQLATLAY